MFSAISVLAVYLMTFFLYIYIKYVSFVNNYLTIANLFVCAHLNGSK